MIEQMAPNSPVLLAPADSAQLDAVMTVMAAAFEPGFGEAWTRSQCAGILPMTGVELVVAWGPGRRAPLGFSLQRIVGGEAELLLLGVMPEQRRKGIGRRLLEQFIARAAEHGASRLHLEVRDGNPAIGMYEAAGFAMVGRRRKYYRGQDGRQFDALTLARPA